VLTPITMVNLVFCAKVTDRDYQTFASPDIDIVFNYYITTDESELDNQLVSDWIMVDKCV